MASETSNYENSGLSLQEQLFAGIKVVFPDAEAKKINKDNFLDIYIPTVSPARGTHLFFNTIKGAIKIGYYTRDEDFINKVVSVAYQSIDAASNGLRITGNPKFDDIESAVAAALDFLSAILNEKLDQPINTSVKQVTEVPEIEEINQDLIDAFLEIYGNDDLSEFLENYLVDGEIVVLTIEPEDFIAAVKDDTGYSDLVNTLGSVDMDSWSDLAELIGKKEANKAKKEYKDENPGGIVLFYCDGKYVYSFSKPKEEDSDEDDDNSDYDFDIDAILKGLELNQEEEENEVVELNKFTIPQILEVINSDKKLSQIDISYYTKEYSDLTYTLSFKVQKFNVEVSRVNWFNDSYWASKIGRKELIAGLKNYLKSENSSELIENYFHPDVVDYEFSGAGKLENGLEYHVDSVPYELTDIPEDLQDEDGDLDVIALTNNLLPVNERLSDSNKGKIHSYQISLNGTVYELEVDELVDETDEYEEEVEDEVEDDDNEEASEEEASEEEEVEEAITNKYPVSDYSDLEKLLEMIKEDVNQIRFADISLFKKESNLKELIEANADIFPLLPESFTASKSIRRFAVESGYYDAKLLENIDLDDTSSLYKIINNNANYYGDLPEEYKDRELTKITIRDQSCDITFDDLPSSLQSDPKFLGELLTYLKENLSYEPVAGYSYCETLLDNYKEFFTNDDDIIIKNRLLDYASERLIQDREFYINYLKANPDWYGRLINKNDTLKTDEAFARLAIQLDGANYSELPDEFSSNRELLDMAIENGKGNLMLGDIAEDLLYEKDGSVDVDLLLKIINSNNFNIRSVPEEIMLNSTIASQLILATKSKNNVLYYAPEFLKSDKEFISKLTNENIFTITFAHKSILADREFMQGIVSKMPILIKFCSSELKSDKQFVKEAISLNGLVVRYLDQELLSDPAIYWAALRQNPESFKLLPSEIQSDEAVQTYISNINGGIFADYYTSINSKVIKFQAILNSADDAYPEDLTITKSFGNELSNEQILEMIKIDPIQVVFLPEDYFVKNNNSLLSILEISHYPLKFKSCRNVLGAAEVKRYLKMSPWYLKYVEESESFSDEFLKDLLSINGNLLQYLSKEQKKDISFVLIALQSNPEACQYVSPEFDWTSQDAKSLAKQVLTTDPLLFGSFIEKDPASLYEFFELAYLIDSSVLELMDHTFFDDAWYFVSDSNGSWPLSEDDLINGLNQDGNVFYHDPISNTVKNLCLSIENGLQFDWEEEFKKWDHDLQLIETAFQCFPSKETYQSLKKKLGKKFNESEYVYPEIISKGFELYPHISEDLKKNSAIAFAYLKADDFNDLASKFDELPGSFKKDGTFLKNLSGYKIDFEALDAFFDHSILYDESFLIPYMALNFDQYTYLPEKLQQNRNVALHYGINNNEKSYYALTILELPDKLSKDKELISAICKGNKFQNFRIEDDLINDVDFLFELIEFQPQLVQAIEAENRSVEFLIKLMKKNINVFDYLEQEEKLVPEIFNFITSIDVSKIRKIDWSYTLDDALLELAEKSNVLRYINMFEEDSFVESLSTKYTFEKVTINAKTVINPTIGTQYFIAEPGTITLGYDDNCYVSEDIAGVVYGETIIEFLESDDAWSDYIWNNSWFDYSDIYHNYGITEPATDMKLPNGKIVGISMAYERPEFDSMKKCFKDSSKGEFVQIASSNEKAYGWGNWKSYALEVNQGIFNIANIEPNFDQGIVSGYSYTLPDGSYELFEENEDFNTSGQGFSSTLYFNNGKELVYADDVKDLLEENGIDTSDIEAIKEFLLQHYNGE